MRVYAVGQKLEMCSRHQSTRKFAPVPVVGEVVQSNEGHDYKMKVRVFGDWRPTRGYQHELLRVTDDIWLERIGVPLDVDEKPNLPAVLQIVRDLTDDEFKTRQSELASA